MVLDPTSTTPGLHNPNWRIRASAFVRKLVLPPRSSAAETQARVQSTEQCVTQVKTREESHVQETRLRAPSAPAPVRAAPGTHAPRGPKVPRSHRPPGVYVKAYRPRAQKASVASAPAANTRAVNRPPAYVRHVFREPTQPVELPNARVALQVNTTHSLAARACSRATTACRASTTMRLRSSPRAIRALAARPTERAARLWPRGVKAVSRDSIKSKVVRRYVLRVRPASSGTKLGGPPSRRARIAARGNTTLQWVPTM